MPDWGAQREPFPRRISAKRRKRDREDKKIGVKNSKENGRTKSRRGGEPGNRGKKKNKGNARSFAARGKKKERLLATTISTLPRGKKE